MTDSAPSGDVALILAAERLFAERGIEGVALRQVNQAAKQRNMSAAHYHFGSRDGLVEAILRYRLPGLDDRRRALLEQPSATRDLRFYLQAFVTPLIDELQPRPEGNHFIRFMQQYERHRGTYDFVRSLTPASVGIYAGIEQQLGYFPAEVRQHRIQSLINMVHAVLATTEDHLNRGDIALSSIELIAANVVDMVAAALSAPVSAETLHVLAPGREDATD